MTRFEPERIRAVFESIEAPQGMDQWRRETVPGAARWSRYRSRYRLVPVLVAAAIVAITGGVALGTAALDRPPPGPPVVGVTPSPTASSASPSPSASVSASRITATPRSAAPGTVGVPPGTRLTRHDGDLRITAAGAVVEHLHVAGTVYVEAPNVTLRRVRVAAAGSYWGIRQAERGANLTVEDSEVSGDVSRPVQYGIAQVADRLTVRRTLVRGVENGIVVGVNATIADSRIVELTPGSSTVGIFCFGNGSQISLQGNTVLAPAQANAAVAVYADTGPVSGVSVRDNVVGGGRYALHIGAGVRDVAVVGTRFSRQVSPRGGTDGPARWDARPASATWSGNVWADTEAAVGAP